MLPSLPPSPQPRSNPDEALVRQRKEQEAADAEVLADSHRHTRRSFLGLTAGVAAAFSLYKYLDATRIPGMEMQPTPLRDAFRFNAAAARGTFHDHPLAPTYPLSRAETSASTEFMASKCP